MAGNRCCGPEPIGESAEDKDAFQHVESFVALDTLQWSSFKVFKYLTVIASKVHIMKWQFADEQTEGKMSLNKQQVEIWPGMKDTVCLQDIINCKEHNYILFQ